MLQDRISNAYFEWMCKKIRADKYADGTSFRKLLALLHSIDFEYTISRDANRAEDGMSLRYLFGCEQNDYAFPERYLTGPCSVFEMMVALAIRCEQDIMEDTRYGDRTGQWFWGMVVSLGLGGMTDSRIDENYVRSVIDRFLDRKYERNGKGGLFTIRDCSRDIRKVEIWTQMLQYMNAFLD